MKSSAGKTGLKVLIIVAVCIACLIALFYSCGGSIGLVERDKYLSLDAAYSIPVNDKQQEVYVFCTLSSDEKKNINMAADQAKLCFESNNYSDNYSLNRQRLDSTIKANTEYSGVTDGSHSTILAASGDVEKIAFVFSVGNNDLENGGAATLEWVNYHATVPIDEIQRVSNVEQMIASLSQQQ